VRVEGKLMNSEGELIASGPCEVDRHRGEVTMWPSWELHMLERERGTLRLQLEDGWSLPISDRHLTFKLKDATEQRISVYRLRILERVPEHLAAGYEPADEREEQIAAEIAAEEAERGKRETLHTW
jgi:hypothetical protein